MGRSTKTVNKAAAAQTMVAEKSDDARANNSSVTTDTSEDSLPETTPAGENGANDAEASAEDQTAKDQANDSANEPAAQTEQLDPEEYQRRGYELRTARAAEAEKNYAAVHDASGYKEVATENEDEPAE